MKIQISIASYLEQASDIPSRLNTTPAGLSAGNVASHFMMERSNVSRILNTLWRENKLIKIAGRPTRFLSFDCLSRAFPQFSLSTYYKSQEALHESLFSADQSPPFREVTLSPIQRDLVAMLLFAEANHHPLYLHNNDQKSLGPWLTEIARFLVSVRKISNEQILTCLPTTPLRNSAEYLYLIKDRDFKTEQNCPPFTLLETYSTENLVAGFPVFDIPSYASASRAERIHIILNEFLAQRTWLTLPFHIETKLLQLILNQFLQQDFPTVKQSILHATMQANLRAVEQHLHFMEYQPNDFRIDKNLVLTLETDKMTDLVFLSNSRIIYFDGELEDKLNHVFDHPVIHSLQRYFSILFNDPAEHSTYNKIFQRFQALSEQEYRLLQLYLYGEEGREKEPHLQDLCLSFLKSQERWHSIGDGLQQLMLQNIASVFQKEGNRMDLLFLIDQTHPTACLQSYLTKWYPDSFVLPIDTSHKLNLPQLVQDIYHSGVSDRVILFTDVATLSNLDYLLEKTVGIHARSLYPFSFPLLDYVLKQISQGFDYKTLKTATFFQDKIETILQEEDAFLDQLKHSVLKESLVFLNPDKAIDYLYEALQNIVTALELPFTRELLVKFVVHCCYAIERVIKREPLEYINLRKYLKEHEQLVGIVQNGMNDVSQTFGIEIPPGEIAFIADIFHNTH